ncbi:hypothetical protein ACJ41O_014619 [Fusarium nematophilum]
MPYYEHPYYETLRGDEEFPVELTKCRPPSNSANTHHPKLTRTPTKKVKRFISEDLFRERLAKWLTPNDAPDKKILLDSVFVDISDALKAYGKYEWSLRPRTFSLLWILGIPEKMDVFVAEGRADHYLPYNEGNLPDIIKGSTLRSKFLKLQSIVRCRREDSMSELEEGGMHIHIPGHAEAYFYFLEYLGGGRFAKVYKVYNRRTLKTYALKQIERGQSVYQDQYQLGAFVKELRALKSLSHRHIVKLVGSYTDSEAIGLIMRPVADTDLQQYLDSMDVDPGIRKRSLRCFFGCLATALACIHKKNIRHKDIKPSNVLVKSGQVLLADFGTSRICLDGHLTTNGQPSGTPRYCAPEVMDGAVSPSAVVPFHINTVRRTKSAQDRNTASDIWSLGCVFLEMATTLFGYTHNDMLDFYSRHGSEAWRSICKNIPATRIWIDKLRSSGAGLDSPILDWTEWMLKENPNDRPTAAQLRSKILDTETDIDYICHHCASKDGIEQSESPASGTMVSVNPPAGFEPESDATGGSSDDDSRVSTEAETLSMSSTPSQESLTLIDENPQEPPEAQLEKFRSNESQEPSTTPSEDQATPVGEPKIPERKKVTFSTEDDDQVIELGSATESSGESRQQRFTGLPKHQRPEPTTPQQLNSDDPFNQQETFIPPEPIKRPPFYRRDCLPLPAASLVPSYLLAGANHLSQEEFDDAEDDPGTANVFVYGRLMFPSVLHAIARRSLEGAYSPDLQRRLVLSSDDWGKADLSVQRASELMTPALLRGYSARRPEGSDYAVIQEHGRNTNNRQGHTRKTPGDNPDDVVGFLITGLSREAVRYLDLLFATTDRNLYLMKPKTSERRHSERSEMESMLQRQSVEVDVELNTGSYATIHAHTYIWKYAPLKPDLTLITHQDNRISLSSAPWDGNKFVHGRWFQDMLDSDSSTRKEEQTIARQMGISYALVGDYLCRAILAHDTRELKRLLDSDWYANSPCRVYGSPLQASVAVGNEDMAQLLLDYGADVNAQGGRYGAPIIAAAFGARRSITRMLLHNGANVFATHPLHANALYQAVGHSDYAIAEMLLEHAAWLTDDWGEVCDLAEETGDREVESLLREYDVREIHRKYLLASPSTRFTSIAEKPSWRHISGIVLRKGLAVQGMPGNWRGIKGVAVVVAALNAGASIELLGVLRKTVGPLQAVIEALKKSDEIAELKYKEALESGVMYSDVEDSAGEEEAPRETKDERRRESRREKERPVRGSGVDVGEREREDGAGRTDVRVQVSKRRPSPDFRAGGRQEKKEGRRER